jgi:polyferredoxin
MGGEVTVTASEHVEKRVAAPPRRVRVMEKRIRISAVLLILGLLIEAFSLHWAHPTAFVVFVGIGGTMIGAGILLFLYSVLASWQRSSSV